MRARGVGLRRRGTRSTGASSPGSGHADGDSASSAAAASSSSSAQHASDAIVSIVFRTHGDVVSRRPFVFCPHNFGLPDPVDATTTTTATATATTTNMASTSMTAAARHRLHNNRSSGSGDGVSNSRGVSRAVPTSFVEAILELREGGASSDNDDNDDDGYGATAAATTTSSSRHTTTTATATAEAATRALSSDVGKTTAGSHRTHAPSPQPLPPSTTTTAGGGTAAVSTRTRDADRHRAITSSSSSSRLSLLFAKTPRRRPRMTPHGHWICRATACTAKEATHSNGAVSVHHTLASQCALVNDVAKGATLCRVLHDYADVQRRYGLSYVELCFEQQYVSRADMLLITAALRERIVYAGEELLLCGFRLRVGDLLQQQQQTQQQQQQQQHSTALVRVGCGVVTAATCVNYRSLSPLHGVVVELSREMWSRVVDGRTPFAWALRQFLREWLHVRLPQHKAATPARVRVVIAGRLRRAYALDGEEDVVHTLDVTMAQTTTTNTTTTTAASNNTTTHATSLAAASSSTTTAATSAAAMTTATTTTAAGATTTTTMMTVSGGGGGGAGVDVAEEVLAHCEAFVRRVLRAVAAQHGTTTTTTTSTTQCNNNNNNNNNNDDDDTGAVCEAAARDAFVCAKHSNTLDVLALLAEQCTRHYRDRALHVTGHVLTVITAGTATYAARNARVQQLNARLYDVGVRKISFVCLGRPPLHVTPLLQYSRADASLRSQYHLYNAHAHVSAIKDDDDEDDNNDDGDDDDVDDDGDDDGDAASSSNNNECGRHRHRRRCCCYYYEVPAWARALFYVPCVMHSDLHGHAHSAPAASSGSGGALAASDRMHTTATTASGTAASAAAVAAPAASLSSFVLLTREAWRRVSPLSLSCHRRRHTSAMTRTTTTTRLQQHDARAAANGAELASSWHDDDGDSGRHNSTAASSALLRLPSWSSQLPPYNDNGHHSSAHATSLRLPATTPTQRRCRASHTTRRAHVAAAAAASPAVRLTCVWYRLHERPVSSSSSTLLGSRSSGDAGSSSSSSQATATAAASHAAALAHARAHAARSSHTHDALAPTATRCDAVACSSVLVDSDVARGTLVLELTLTSACRQNNNNSRTNDAHTVTTDDSDSGRVCACGCCRCCPRWSSSLCEDDAQWQRLMACFYGSDDRLPPPRQQPQLTTSTTTTTTATTTATTTTATTTSSSAWHASVVPFAAAEVFCRVYSGVARDATTLLLATHPSDQAYDVPTRVHFACDARLLAAHTSACEHDGHACTTTAAAAAALSSSSLSPLPCVVVAHIQLRSHLLFAITPIDPLQLYDSDTRDARRALPAHTPTAASASTMHDQHDDDDNNSKDGDDDVCNVRSSSSSAAPPLPPPSSTSLHACGGGGGTTTTTTTASTTTASALWSSWTLAVDSISTAALFRRRWYYRHPVLPPSSSSMSSHDDGAWSSLCSCAILPLYGVRATYSPDSFYTVPPHQYTLDSHGTRAATATATTTTTDADAATAAPTDANEAGDVRRRLCAFVLQRLQQQYQIIVTDSSNSSSSSGDAASAWLSWHAASTATCASLPPPPPHMRIEMSVGHQTHTLKLTESGTAVAITRALHRGVYDSHARGVVAAAATNTATTATTASSSSSCGYRFALWNYLADVFEVRRVLWQQQQHSSSSSSRVQHPYTTDEDSDDDDANDGSFADDDDDDEHDGSIVSSSSGGDGGGLPWERLDSWLQHYPDQPLPRQASLLCAREVAMVLLPLAAEQQPLPQQQQQRDNMTAVACARDDDVSDHKAEVLLTPPPLMPPFATFLHFITTRFSVYLQTRNRVLWYDGARDTHTSGDAADEPGNDDDNNNNNNKNNNDDDDNNAMLTTTTTAILVQDASQTYEVRTHYDHVTGRAVCVDAPADERVMSFNAIFAPRYDRRCAYTLRVRWLQCAASVVAEWCGAYMASASRFHMRAVPLTCHAQHDSVLDAFSVYYSVYANDNNNDNTNNNDNDVDKSTSRHTQAVAAHTADSRATARLCAMLQRVLTTSTFAYYVELPAPRMRHRHRRARRRRLVHASGQCYVVLAPAPRVVAWWCVNTRVAHAPCTAAHAALLAAFVRAVQQARQRCATSLTDEACASP